MSSRSQFPALPAFGTRSFQISLLPGPRILKELRPLLVPFVLSLAGAVLLGFNLDPEIGLLALIGGTALLATCCFGSEVHHRTGMLLLSQPVSRASIWRDKWMVLLPVVFAVHLAFVWSWSSGHHARRGVNDEIFIVATTGIVACLLSAPFWIGIARSIIGALILNLAASFVLFLIALFLAENRVFFRDIESSAPAVGFGYAVAMLVLGWRQFLHAEMINAAMPRAEAEAKAVLGSGLGIATPRCGRRSRLLNRLRVELCLQKTTIGFAAIFAAVGLAFAGLDAIAADRDVREILDFVRYAPLFIGMFGVAVLAAPTALCEEKALGTEAMHLMLPGTTRRRFFEKVAASGIAMLALGISLPALVLALHEGFLDRTLFSQADLGALITLQAAAFGVFLISIRIAATARSTFQAVLATMIVGAASVVLWFWFWDDEVREFSSQPLNRDSLLWTITETHTPAGPLPFVMAGAIALVMILFFLRAASLGYGRLLSMGSFVVHAAGTSLLPMFVATVFWGAWVVQRANETTQIETYWSLVQPLQTALTRLEGGAPARRVGETQVYSLTQVRQAAGGDIALLSRFQDPNQRFVVHAYTRNSPVGRRAAVQIVPPLVIEENSHPLWGELSHFQLHLPR